MRKLKKLLGAGILGLMIWQSGGALTAVPSVAEAAYENPFSDIQYKEFKGEEEKAYIEQVTTAMFSGAPLNPPVEYVTPKGWQREVLTFNNVTVEQYVPEQRETERVVLFLHGGGYIGGLHNRYRDWAVNLAELAGKAELLAVDYRIAPQFKYPAALEDALAAYEGILSKGYNPEKMIIVGDSAGGNLAAALLVALRDKGMPLPKLGVLISPWTSFSAELPSRVRNFTKDKILGEKNKRMTPAVLASDYAKGTAVTDPYLSPVFADLSGLPKLLIIAGADELLLDDTVLFAQYAKNDGVDVTTRIYQGMSHDWTLLLPELPETKAAFEEITAFINRGMK